MATRLEAWDLAKRMVVSEGATYAEAAEASGIPVSTLQKRAAADEWQGQRSTVGSYIAQIRAIKSEMLADIQGTSPGADKTQKIFALVQLEKAYPEHRYTPPVEDPELKKRIALEVLELLATYLEGTDRTAFEKLRGHFLVFGKQLEARYGAAA